MDPIDTQRNEHGLIRRFVDLLSQAVTRLEVENPPARRPSELTRNHKLNNA